MNVVHRNHALHDFCASRSGNCEGTEQLPLSFDSSQYRDNLCSLCGKNVFNLLNPVLSYHLKTRTARQSGFWPVTISGKNSNQFLLVWHDPEFHGWVAENYLNQNVQHVCKSWCKCFGNSDVNEKALAVSRKCCGNKY